jgi:hypothetical protein
VSTARRRNLFNSHGKFAWPSIAQKVSAFTATLNNITATLPGAITSGNKLIAVFRSGQATASQVNHVAPAGWTKVVGQNRAATACISIWYKDAGAGESTSMAFSDAGATSAYLDVFEYAGLVAGTADKTASVDGTATLVSTLTVGPTAATTTARELAIAAIGLAGTATWNNTWTNGFVQRTVTAGADRRLSTATKTLTAAADTPSTKETWTTARNCAGVIATFAAKVL